MNIGEYRKIVPQRFALQTFVCVKTHITKNSLSLHIIKIVSASKHCTVEEATEVKVTVKIKKYSARGAGGEETGLGDQEKGGMAHARAQKPVTESPGASSRYSLFQASQWQAKKRILLMKWASRAGENKVPYVAIFLMSPLPPRSIRTIAGLETDFLAAMFFVRHHTEHRARTEAREKVGCETRAELGPEHIILGEEAHVLLEILVTGVVDDCLLRTDVESVVNVPLIYVAVVKPAFRLHEEPNIVTDVHAFGFIASTSDPVE